MYQNGRLLLAIVVTLIAVVLLPAVPAASQPGALDDEKQQSLTIYGWIYGQNGDIIVQGIEADVDVSISDAWDALSALDGLFVLHYENRNGPRTLFADVMYTRLEASAGTALGDVTFDQSTTIAELGWAVRTARKERSDGRVSTGEWLAGVRYTRLALGLAGPLGTIDVDGTRDWFDLFIGGRVAGDLSDRWGYWVRGDIGGFGIGSSSDFTWNLILGLNYDMGSQWDLELGWRWLDYSYDDGSGADRFEYDVLSSGPFTGITYSF